MKKLYENIEDFNIKGDIGQLSVMVSAMDHSLQNIADYTDKLYEFLAKYSASNKGLQYERVIASCKSLRDELYTASVELNDMQNQIVIYQNKIYKYEELSETAQKPNSYNVTRRSIEVDVSIHQFNRSEMMEVIATLRNYEEAVRHHLDKIIDKKNSLAQVWRDSQYDIFAVFIEDVNKNTTTALQTFDDYVLYLDEKVKGL